LATEHPALLTENVNVLMHADKRKRMFRTMDGDVRAVLSNRYRRLDYFDFLSAILPIIKQSGMKLMSCQVTERKLYLKCVNERMQGKVVGDVVQGGLVFTNSEVGFGKMKIQILFYTLDCENGMVGESVFDQYHLGGAQGEDEDKVQEMLSTEAKAADEKALWLKVRDVTDTMLTDTDRFEERIAKLNTAAGEAIEGDIEGAVVELQKATKITDASRKGILKRLYEGGDFTKWGLSSAVTRHSQDVESYDEATELEELGHKVIELPNATWKQIATADEVKVKAS
jgi:hypothetical protein